jgi:uncharacterized membrane protein
MPEKTVKSKKQKIQDMTILAMFTAIILIMIFVPYFGFITIFGIPSVTLIHLPVLIGAAMLGRKAGVFLGFVFGVGSLIRGMTSVGLDYLFIFPWVSILPRVIFGLLIYDVCRLISRFFTWLSHRAKWLGWMKVRILALSVSFALLTIIHTLMVLPMLVTTFPIALGNASIAELVGSANMSFVGANASFQGLLFIIGLVFLSNGLIEALLAATIGAVVADRLIAFQHSNEIRHNPEGGETNAGID